jgi:hypothetical protein
MTYYLVQGNITPVMTITLKSDGVAFELNGAIDVVTLTWLKPDETLTIVSMEIVDAVAGIVRRTWVDGDTDQAGFHRGQIDVVRSGGIAKTWPNDGTFILWEVIDHI